MLLEMHIKNFAIIDQAYLQFDNGLNVFTGETGAGKTLLVTAMNMLLGDRADTSLIRSGCKHASIEGLFNLCANDKTAMISYEAINNKCEDLVMAREILEEGKSKCYMNGKISTVGQLSSIGEKLVDLHGQHEHQSLLTTQSHLAYLDAFGGKGLSRARSEYEQTHTQVIELKRKLKQLDHNKQENLRKEDLLKFQINEINSANVKIGEDEELEKQRQILMHMEKLQQATTGFMNSVAGFDESQLCALNLMREAASSLQQVKDLDERIAGILQSYESLIYATEDSVQAIREYIEQIEFEPSTLDETEARLSLLALLKKKYGPTIKDILRYEAKALEELEAIVNSENEVATLKATIAQTENKLAQLASALSSQRSKWAKILCDEVQTNLFQLDMERVKFEIVISQVPDDAGLRVGNRRVKTFASGIDKVEFFVATNPGEPLKPLSRIASGGEISRIMLAIKIALAEVDDIMTMVFDEIDVGIGGKTAFAVGQKLAHLAQTHQVICVTHLPQIASFADRHFYISKREQDERTMTSVTLLDKEGQLNEIARMLSGQTVSNLSRSHAAETIQRAAELKKTIRKGRYAAV